MNQQEKDYSPVVEPAWLRDRLGEASLLIIEVGDQGEDNYRTGHIPGAIYLDTNTIERPPSWNVLAVPELQQVLLSHGITSAQPTLLYGRDPLAVARTALVLLYAGVEDIRWLDGGIEAWKASGHELETQPRTLAPAPSYGCPLPAHPEYLADISQVRLGLTNPNTVIACVRTWEEYAGRTSGYDYIQPRGRIAGSVWAGEPDFDRREYPSPDALGQTGQRCREIASLWRRRGITPDRRIIFYCGTGWRASEAFLCAWLMGWKDIAVYDGGWLEWSADTTNPVEP